MMHKDLEQLKDQYVEEILELTKDGISMKNIELVDVLTHTAKNLCKLMEGGENYGRGYGEGYERRRDSMGRYASDGEWKERLHRMEEDAPGEYARRSIREYGERMR